MAVGINSQGDVVGLYSAGGTQHGFLLSRDGALSSLDFPGPTLTNAWAINPRGDIVGAYVGGGKLHGFIRHKDGHWTSFDVPNAIHSQLTLKARLSGNMALEELHTALYETWTVDSAHLMSPGRSTWLLELRPVASPIVAISWAGSLRRVVSVVGSY
jgi:hypothetical protein